MALATLSPERAMALALDHHRAGRWSEAELIYRAILQQNPQHADALHFVGLIAFQRGQFDAAERDMRQAIALVPDRPAFWNNLGLVYRALGNPDEARTCYLRALEILPSFCEAYCNLGNLAKDRADLDQARTWYERALDVVPTFPLALNNLGTVLHEQGKFAEAVDIYQRALASQPTYAEAYSNLGTSLCRLQRTDEAIVAFQKAVSLKPDHFEAHNNWGLTCKQLGRFQEAAEHYRQALAIKPDFVGARNNLGVALKDLKRFDEAERELRQVLAAEPKYADAYNNLGNVLKETGRLDEAMAAFQQAIECLPSLAEAHNNLGNCFRLLGDDDQALACFAVALEHKPDYPDVRLNRALSLLRLERFAEGWPEFEVRLKLKVPPRRYPRPRWDGGPIAGKTIVLHAEQGLGDTIQFFRYAQVVQQRGARVVADVQPVLWNLLRHARGIDELVGTNERLPECDLVASLVSMPFLLQDQAAVVPYLDAEPGRLAHWRARTASVPGFRVGVVWQGNPEFPHDRYRSIPLTEFAPLAQVAGVTLLSLQKGFGAEQIRANPQIPVVAIEGDWDETYGPFVDTAAILKCLDLVITSDTSIVHLAGAMGVPTWLATPFAPDWRWYLRREDSPWYPSVRLFRQRRLGDWTDVFARMADELAKLQASKQPDPKSES